VARRFHRIDAGHVRRKRESRAKNELLQWTSNIVAAYLSNNEVDLRQLPQVLETVYGKLAALGQLPAGRVSSTALEQILNPTRASSPSVALEKSVTPDHIICLEDGVRLKTLKRYLFRKYRLTPEQYRLKWGLPPDYPMVSPNYAAKRSALAKKMGLGRKGRVRRRKRR
jgi:predicted transcriptional regulator